MPNLKAAKKALKQNVVKKVRNLRKKRLLKSLLKNLNNFINSNDIEKAIDTMPGIYKRIDKNKKAGIIKKNAASRQKSKIAKMINNLKK